jgi:dinuclear metal center YbgI/SA1388 family protein
MTKVNEIIEKIENFAPLSLQSEWDNSGWQVYLGNFDIDKVLLALSPTFDVIEQAVEKKCELIISHHPLIFSKINKLNINNFADKSVIKAVQNNIQIYSAHTNLDVVQGGVADKLANLLNLKNLSIIGNTDTNSGFGRIGELEQEQNLEDFLTDLKKVLNIDSLRLINPTGKTKVKKIAVCPGSGGDFIQNLTDVDLYITGDIRYHTALEVNNMAVADAGHMETEQIILPVIKDLLKEFKIDTFIAQEKSPWQTI